MAADKHTVNGLHRPTQRIGPQDKIVHVSPLLSDSPTRPYSTQFNCQFQILIYFVSSFPKEQIMGYFILSYKIKNMFYLPTYSVPREVSRSRGNKPYFIVGPVVLYVHTIMYIAAILCMLDISQAIHIRVS
jgi:hypothetical protein